MNGSGTKHKKNKKVVLVFAVLLTSAAAMSLILATSRYVGFLTHPESFQQSLAFRVAPRTQELSGLEIGVSPVGGDAEGVSPLLVSTFWLFEVSVVNQSAGPVDVDFDRITLRYRDREARALSTEAVLRLFNERMTGAFTAAVARRGYKEALDQLQSGKLGVVRVFPGYDRKSLVFFQPHPDMPDEAELSLYGIRWVEGEKVAPLAFRVFRDGAG